MSPIMWRWEEKDFGFRFRSSGRKVSEYYQARHASEFYIVSASQRKILKQRIDELASSFSVPSSTQIVANPWQNYERDWDWIATEDGIAFNWAGCLDQEEIRRREDEGVQRAMELVADLATRQEPVRLSLRLLQEVHVELMGAIYPFAGRWRTVALHKGEGPTKWPMPSSGIQPLMDVLERDVLSRSPIVSDEDESVFSYASEVMNELLAIHPFREGNGRTVFIICNLILMQNNLLPLTTYQRRSDEARYFSACEAGRIHGNYEPLAKLLSEWEDKALQQWREQHE